MILVNKIGNDYLIRWLERMVARVSEIKSSDRTGEHIRYSGQLRVPFIGIGIRTGEREVDILLGNVYECNLKNVPDQILS